MNCYSNPGTHPVVRRASPSNIETGPGTYLNGARSNRHRDRIRRHKGRSSYQKQRVCVRFAGPGSKSANQAFEPKNMPLITALLFGDPVLVTRTTTWPLTFQTRYVPF